MRDKSVLYSSSSDEWSTPGHIFRELDEEFHFTLDPCATDENHKTDQYYTIDQDGLSRSWAGNVVFCNPPYSRIGDWAKKCREEHDQNGTRIVMLVPARVDTRWFHDYIYGHAELRFPRGRLRFNGSRQPAPFPSMIVIF